MATIKQGFDWLPVKVGFLQSKSRCSRTQDYLQQSQQIIMFGVVMAGLDLAKVTVQAGKPICNTSVGRVLILCQSVTP